ncbi:MAG: putative aliphatic sulfonates transport permease protein SsuC [Syntrophorhabdaceae bacterium PtaU1.Bin034]|nr:MAG: putative aliphatic sulfonates transport permease protein SsuC [Syntrophorhabdaceae bacterium PtaU1.Bin034]
MSNETGVLDERKELPPARIALSTRRYVASLPFGTLLTGMAVPVLLVLLWETAGQLKWVRTVFLPTPSSVVSTFFESVENDRFLLDFWVSIYTVVRGFIWGGLLGLGFGTMAGLSKTVERLFGPLLNSIRQVPAIAFLPLIILWVGIGDLGKLVVIGKAVFFPVFLNTLQGIRSVSHEYVEVAKVYQFTRAQLIRRVIFPAALPTIFVGIRYGAGMAWAMIVAAEMLSGRIGLGYVLTRGQELLLTKQVFVVIVVIGLVGYLIDTVIVRVEKRFVKWKKSFAT